MLGIKDIKRNKIKFNNKEGEVKGYLDYSILSGKINGRIRYKYNLLLFIYFGGKL